MKMTTCLRSLVLSSLFVGTLSCDDQKPSEPPKPTSSSPTPPPDSKPLPPPTTTKPAATVEEVQTFISTMEPKFKEILVLQAKAMRMMETNINFDSEYLNAHFTEVFMAYLSQVTPTAVAYLNDPNLKLPEETRRKLTQLVMFQVPLPSPMDAQKQKALADVITELQSGYGKLQFCLADGSCFGQKETEARMGAAEYMTPAKQDVLLETWVNWHNQARGLRKPFVQFVDLANQGAHDLHYKDLGDLWRANYDMTPEEFEKEVERLWTQVEPLYKSLHCYVRAKLSNYYGKDKVSMDGLIPAHLLGNLWSQEWGGIYPIVAPPTSGSSKLDITPLLQAWVSKKLDPHADVTSSMSVPLKSDADILKRADQIQAQKQKAAILVAGLGEGFFDSLGLGKLPQTFWERSMLIKPRDRKVVCHASAEDLGFNGDVRLKMCIEPTAEDFRTVHHELGHDYYFLAYHTLSPLFQNGANDGFHEAIGDAISLSITPEYLVKIGLLDKAPESNLDGELRQLLKDALTRVAFLPFGKVLDQWRWDVFSGKIKPENYNKAFWDLRAKYQGITPPVARTEEDFDPGAKYHIPNNVPYTRYFLARILQFQFHRALCKAAGYQGPLHKCSIYGSKEAGQKLQAMLSLGTSRPWPDALQALSGETKMDAGALLEYYKPLMAWLNEQNKDQKCGW